MKKRLKFAGLLLLISVFVFGFVSCKESNTAVNGDSPLAADDDVIYSPYVGVTVVLGEGIDNSDISAIRNAYFTRTGKEAAIASSDNAKASHEIIVGKTDRELSEKAYHYLDRFKKEEGYVGYVFYSDGKSVAIAFDDAVLGVNIAFSEAINYFTSEYMKSDTLKLSNGAVCSISFDPIEKQEALDKATADRLWELKLSQISAKINGDEETANAIIKALQNIDALLNEDHGTVKWLANLYDPVTGGFYHSNSARNNEGFAPDLGATAQALGLVEAILTGYGGTLTDYFGEEIANKFVSFAKNMQDSNGYFYHPQWSRELIEKTPERKSVDVLNALNILEAFNAAPIYDTPNGVKGEGVAAVSKLTYPLCESKVSAVSQLVDSESDAVYIPAYLKSEEDFNNYLSSLNIRADVAGVSQTLYAELPLYIEVDKMLEESGASYRLCELLKDYLGKTKNYTGVWSSVSNPSYDEIGDLVGVIKIYNALGVAIPNYDATLDLILGAMTFYKEPESINDIAAVWTALDYTINNLKAFTNEALQDRLSSEIGNIYFGFETLVNATRDKLILFTKNDGSVASTTDGSAYESYGMSVAVPLSDEGDVYGTILATKSIWLSIFGVLGIADVPVFETSDRMVFQKTLLDMGVIIKNEVKETEPESFELYEIGQDGDVQIKADGNTEVYASVIEGPEGMGNVLNLYAPSTSGKSQFYFKNITSQVRNPSCYSYEFDMCFLPCESDGFLAYVYLYYYYYLIGFRREGDIIGIVERTNQWDAGDITDLGARVNIGEWFNLRVEYYFGTNETIRIKIYFSSETERERCIAVTDNYIGSQDENSTPPNSELQGITLWGVSKKEINILMDNLLIETSYKTYTPETSSDLNINIDTPDKKQTVHDFEDQVVGSTPTNFTSNGTSSSVTVITDADKNNMLSVSEKAGEVILPLDQRGVGTNSAVIEFDFIMDKDSAVGAKYQINFNEYLYLERTFGAVQLVVTEENGSKYATIVEITTAGKTSTTYSNVKLALGVEYNLRLHLFYKERVMVISVDDEIVGINTNVLSKAHKYYMGETTIEALTPSLKSALLIDNLVSERIVSDYEEATSPEIPRVEYTFDDEDTGEKELYGIEPSDGVLSFNTVEGDEAYIMIPINTRVNVPTLTVVKFDVAKTETQAGEMVIRLTDESGNVITALALVKNGQNVDVHEYTENGRFSVSIYTITASSFSFAIRYSEEKQGYNIFIDDTYITSSSLMYSEASGEYELEYVRISCNISTGLSIDNLYAEKVTLNLATTSGAVTNSDNTAPVLTYDYSSFVSIPSKIAKYLYSADAALNIKEDKVYGKVSKVLEFYTDGETSDTIIFSRTQTVENTNAAFFETDFMLKSTGGEMKVKLEFGAIIDSTYPIIYEFVFATAGEGAPITVTTKDYTATLDESITEGKWFKLRLEYTGTPYDFNYDGLNDCITRVYADGVFVGEGITANNLNKVPDSKDMKRIRCGLYSGIEGSVFFDNTTLSQCNMEYDTPIPADTDTLTFTPGVVTYQTVFTLGKSTSTASVVTDTADAVNKLLEFYTSAGSSDKMSVIVTQENESANAVMFETDIMITPVTDTAVFYLEPETAKSKYPFRLTLKATKGGTVTISADDIPETEIGSCGEMIHLRIEYMNPMIDYTGDNVYDILYKIYIGESEEAVATGYKAYSSSSYYKPLELTKFVLTPTAETEAEVLFDNIRFWQVERTPDEAENSGSADDSSIGGKYETEVDENGWT